MITLDNFETHGNPEQKERGYIWRASIGLQNMSGSKVSDFLISVANQNINGDITVHEARKIVEDYYDKKSAKFKG